MSSVKNYFDTLITLLEKEQKADRDDYMFRLQAQSVEERVKQGVCWYPVYIEKQYYGMAERLCAEISCKKSLSNDHLFQPGTPVGLFTNSRQGPLHKRQVNAVINWVQGARMAVTFNIDELPEWIDEGKMGVQLVYDEATYKEMFAALNTAKDAANQPFIQLRDSLIFPKYQNLPTKRSLSFTGLNEPQNRAVQHVVDAEKVAIIHGPPGTGKTTTLVEAIFQTLQNESQVMVCAPSNAAVDLLVEKMVDRGLSVVRIGHPARVNDKLLQHTLDSRMSTHEQYKDLKNLRKKADEYRKLAARYRRNFGREEMMQRKMLLDEAKKMLKEAEHLEYYLLNSVLEKSQVVACTLNGAANRYLESRTFRTLFIDEAAQALEPSCWIALKRARKVVFAGDHQQLPPTIKSYDAAREGLAETLFEKLMKFKGMGIMLEVQYRMHADIMGFSSNEFYDGGLMADNSVASQVLFEDDNPVEWVDTAGCGFNEQQDTETKSTYNKSEALFLIRYLHLYLSSIGLERISNENTSFGIIAPYKAQVKYITQLFEEDAALKTIRSNITIQTVDAFQGQERDVMVIGFTRSNSKGEIGFLSDLRRTNVAITRARKKLILVGDSATLASNPFYERLLRYTQHVEGYKSAWENMDLFP